MLDAFKNLTGGKGKLTEQQTTELEALIATAREERSAISAMLTALTTRSAKLAPVAKSLEQVTEKATTIATRLDDITRRLTTLDQGARGCRQAHPDTEGCGQGCGTRDTEGPRT